VRVPRRCQRGCLYPECRFGENALRVTEGQPVLGREWTIGRDRIVGTLRSSWRTKEGAVERLEASHSGFDRQLRIRPGDRNEGRGAINLIDSAGKGPRARDQCLRAPLVGEEARTARSTRVGLAGRDRSLESIGGGCELRVHRRVLRHRRCEPCRCRIESEIPLSQAGVDVEERRSVRLHVRNVNSKREAIRESRLEDERESRDVIAQSHLGVPERRIPVRVAGERLKSGLEARQVGELPYADSIESEIDAEGLQRAGWTAGRVQAVALVERRPLPNGPKPQHTPGKHQGVITYA